MIDIRGKWALVTGASRGIGRLAALCLAKQGCNIVAQSRELAHTDTLLSELKEMGIEAYAVAAELSDITAVNRMLQEIEANGTQIDIVLNNAAVQIAYRTNYFETPVEDYTTSFQINTIAPMIICYHYLPKMMERGFGRIVNTTSGIRLEPEQAGYSASKAALDKVTIDIGSKLEGTDVIISLADPGWCRTDLGGPNAPNAPESAIPGVVVGAFINDGKSGRLFSAGEFAGMTLEEAVTKAETMPSLYN
ncbi:MAG: SDR family oxidoreductase [Oscillospiraceae bacterium]|nr:SDR family oxidoreductase [Oscillospiraceae bacterium]MBR6617098.1 SDR family oxidoreductase [Oscillospiraceae bacterium]